MAGPRLSPAKLAPARRIYEEKQHTVAENAGIVGCPINPVPGARTGQCCANMSSAPERVFLNLNVVQSEGLACVMCGRPFLAGDPSSAEHVGWSDAGGRVFACADLCADLAEMDS